jgi:hypothetical protein
VAREVVRAAARIGLGAGSPVLWAIAALVCISLGSCEAPKASSDVEGPRDIPRCKAVDEFGSGASCSNGVGVVDLQLCGNESDAVCTPGRLCFRSAEAAACSCTTNEDCEGYTAYVNAARESAGQAPIGPRCEGGACSADLDLPVGAEMRADAGE